MPSISQKAKAVCESHYDLHNKKNPGCGKCPIQSECHGTVMRSFRLDSLESFDKWKVAINNAAEADTGSHLNP